MVETMIMLKIESEEEKVRKRGGKEKQRKRVCGRKTSGTSTISERI